METMGQEQELEHGCVMDGGPPPALGPQPDAWSLALGVYRHSVLRPQAPAVSLGERTLNYAELARQAGGLARWLRGGPWPAPDGQVQRVGIMASRSMEACVAALGAAWAGATYVPIAPKLPAERLARMLARCQLSALVTDAQGAQTLAAADALAWPAHVLVLGSEPPPKALVNRVDWLPAQALAAGAWQPPQPMAADALAYILFTSGTTGEPKGVMVPVIAVRHYVDHMTPYLGLQASDRVLDVFELGFDVSVHNMFCTWQAGGCLHMLPPAQVMNAVRLVRANELTVWNSVPSLVGLLEQVGALGPGVMPSLRLSSFGGEQLTSHVVQTWARAAPHSRMLNLYGPTEATVTCLAQAVEPPWPVRAGGDVMAIGRPLPGCQAAVIDAQGQPVAQGEAGELAVAGVQLAQGYLQAPELTQSRFVQRDGQRWYRTGDLAVCDAQGRFHCLGRVDHQVKVRGHRVELEDVEAHLRRLLGGALVAAVAWPRQGAAAQGLVAFAGGPVDAVQVLARLREQLPPYMWPSRVVGLSQMPVNANGKVDRQALLQLLESGAA